MRILLIPVIALACSTGATTAALFTATDSVVSTIPDGSSTGVARALSISAPGQSIAGIEVSVNISFGSSGVSYLGDLYLYLSNGSEMAVLMNRPGRRASALFGYGDNQSADVTFSSAPGNDFHTYRIPATGSESTPLASTLTGIWEADGRLVDPSVVLDSSPRMAGLDVFAGDSADGNWNLFAADLSTGGTHQINSWSLNLTTVPEPGSISLTALGLAAALLRRRR